jgi:hypothetical protein
MNALLELWDWLGPDVLAEIIVSAATSALVIVGLWPIIKKACANNFCRPVIVFQGD